MRRRGMLLAIALFGCSEAEKVTEVPGAPEVPAYQGDHPLDEVLHPLFVREGIEPSIAPRPELCRRMFADLIGRLPSAREIEQECAGPSIDAIASALQSRPEYLLQSERHWRDRMAHGEMFLDWRYHRELYARVDDLHLGRLRYDDFAREAAAHPALFLEADQPVRVAFNAFLGRPASEAEEAGLAPLYRPWFVGELTDPDFPYLERYVAAYDPEACEYGGGCWTALYGGAEVDTDGDLEPLLFEDMSTSQLRASQAIGELITAQPLFWEAGADEILDRFLGWSDGGRTPRRPGTVLPEVRRALAEHLEDTGDYPGAERLVMTSWLYGMAVDANPGKDQIYAHGPLKAASAEVWLDTLLAMLAIDLGTCDPRYLGSESEFALYDALEMGLIDEATYQADGLRLHRLQENRVLFEDGEVNDTYAYLANVIGGCPLEPSERYQTSALAFGYAQEGLTQLLCTDGMVERDAPLVDELQRQMRALLGRDPTPAEVADFEAVAQPGPPGADICIALAGSAELLFY